MTPQPRRILIVGGGTAGWLTAAWLAKALNLGPGSPLQITLLESPGISGVGVGEGAFPTFRSTLQFLGIDEAAFIRATSATLKQGIRFVDWGHGPDGGSVDQRHVFYHPFEAPQAPDGLNLVPYWLLQDPATRAPFAQAMTLQTRVMQAHRAPKRAGEAAYTAPLNYAYHFDTFKLAGLLAERARQLGVRHEEGTVCHVQLDERGAIAHIDTDRQARFEAELYIDCTGFRAELIGRALGRPLTPVSDRLFVDRALACKLPLGREAVMESCTIATAHEAGWLWDIGLNGERGVGCVYSSRHLSDEQAGRILGAYCGASSGTGTGTGTGSAFDDITPRSIPFTPGYRTQPWVHNCVAVGLSAGFLDPLESTGLVLIEAAVAMIAEMLPHSGPMDAPARRFSQLMSQRYENILHFLKLHYALSRRPEPFWQDHRDPTSMPPRLAELLDEWKTRPPGRFDFELDTETFAWFNYQYILYGMGYPTDLEAGRAHFPQGAEAERQFARIRRFAERAVAELPGHRGWVEQVGGGGLGGGRTG